MGSCRARSVYLTTLLLARLSPLSGKPEMCTLLVNRLEDKACPVKVWLDKLAELDINPVG